VTSRPVGGKTMSSGGYTSVVAVSLSLMGSPFCAAAALGSALCHPRRRCHRRWPENSTTGQPVL